MSSTQHYLFLLTRLQELIICLSFESSDLEHIDMYLHHLRYRYELYRNYRMFCETHKNYHILSADLANSISTIKGFNLKANLIWFDQSKSLHVYGYPYSFVPSMIHQNVLIFKKEIDED
mgnify:CR=1 FL=1